MLPLFYKRPVAPNERHEFINTLYLDGFFSYWFGGELLIYY